MKKWLLFLVFFAGTISSCEVDKIGPEQTTYPVITEVGASNVQNGGKVASVQKVYVQANISNKYGSFSAQVIYDITWTDSNGVEQKEQKTTNAYYFKASNETVFYQATIPAQKGDRRVDWMIVVTNENGLTSISEPQYYTVFPS